MAGLVFFELVSIFFMLFINVYSKECTNIPTQLSSHTMRYELLSSKNDSWREELFSFYHLIPTDDSAWSNLRPRRFLKDGVIGGIDSGEEFSWAMLYRSLKTSGGSHTPNSGKFLREIALNNVRLDTDSMHGRAQQTNLEYLLLLDVDSLVWSFRKTANLSTNGKPYGGWEDPSCELRGHFVGHYLSASAQMWASTHNDSLYKKMSAVVSSLHECQKAINTGYLSAFPSEQFDRFEAIKPVWAPYYTIHKILAGLLDQYSFAASTQAYQMAVWMVEYFGNRVQNVIAQYSLERHWTSLNEETGGMNDVLYRLYSISGDPKHLVLAHLFDKPCFLGLLAVQADSLSGFHANTHIPVVIGSQMRYEVTGDPLYKAIGTYFMDVVNSSHSYATGGTSVSEFWSDPKRLATTLQTENEESCTTYNMLKVSRHLFRWTKEMAYADYYERALTNGVLSIQRGREPGKMIYMLPLGLGNSKARSYHGWGTQFDSFWCCYGTGVESFSKLGDSIYFEEEGNTPGLYIIQFISSSLSWDLGQIEIQQRVDPVVSWDPYLRVSLGFSRKEGEIRPSTLNLRIPFWTSANGAKATLNGGNLPLPSPGEFLSVTRNWVSGDKLTLQLPISLILDTIKDDRPEHASVQAILFGPYLLAGLTHGDWDIKTGKAKSFSDWITEIPATHNSQLVTFTQDSGNDTLVFTNTNNSITMEKFPASGTDSAVHATFRLISKDGTSATDAIGKSVMLEPFSLPEMVVMHQGPGNDLGVTSATNGSDSGNTETVFRVVAGLNGKSNSVSLQSESQKGCFVFGGGRQKVRLSCKPEKEDDEFRQAASFTAMGGMSKYFPVSFKTKGLSRNFLLMPLLSIRDESYTVYFNFSA